MDCWVCFACLGRRGSGNRTTGKAKVTAALKAFGVKPGPKNGGRPSRVSLCVGGCDKLIERLHELLQKSAPPHRVERMASSYVRKCLAAHSDSQCLLTVIEGPSYIGSCFARVNAELGGASLRIIEPDIDHPSLSDPPPFELGKVVEWPLNLSSPEGALRLAVFLRSVQPATGTTHIHYHASPPCTGCTVVNRNVNRKKLKPKTKAHHILCRRMVADSINHIKAFRSHHGTFVTSQHTRSSSGEQPHGASLPKRSGSSRTVKFYRATHLQFAVSGCVTGLRGQGNKSGLLLPVCKRWVFHTDHPVLGGLFSLLRCPGGHESVKTFVETSCQDLASLSATASYPAGLAWLVIGALSFPWRADRLDVFSP